MPDYWLDSNVFIEAAKGPYAFDIAPGFWALLDSTVIQGRISSSLLVYEELVTGGDELAVWARERRSSGLFPEPDVSVQNAFADLARYVVHSYNTSESSRFLRGADPWIIAHAVAHGGSVVTLEAKAPPNSRRVKIPNVCDQFNIGYANTYQMLRDLGARLGG